LYNDDIHGPLTNEKCSNKQGKEMVGDATWPPKAPSKKLLSKKCPQDNLNPLFKWVL